MVSEKRGVRGKFTPGKVDLEDRERMTQKALSEIEQIGTVAALENCCELADQIAAKLMKAEPEDFADRSAVIGLQGVLERAVAVLKKM